MTATDPHSPYFAQKSITDNHEYVDGGILANNPTQIAWHEANLMWENDLVDVVVSVGTGVTSLRPKAMESILSWANKMVGIATDCRRVDQNFAYVDTSMFATNRY